MSTLWSEGCDGAVVSVAVMMGVPTVVELVMVAWYLPLPSGVTSPIVSPLSVDMKVTVAPLIRVPLSSTVAVAVVLLAPFAGIELGERETETLLAGSVWVSIAWPKGWEVADESVAVIVGVPTVVELVIVTE